MPRNRLSKVYSIYHAMEDRGVFETNKANAQAVNNDGLSIYEGPVQYPKMLYHPKGEMVCITQGIMITDRDNRPVYDELGRPRHAGAVWGMRHVIVENEEQEAEYAEKGWHLTEAAAMRANPSMAEKAPPKTQLELQAERIRELEKMLAEKGAPTPPYVKTKAEA